MLKRANNMAKPEAKGGLQSSYHVKAGRRLVAVIEPEPLSVLLLEPWEHAVLVLADGTRTLDEIAEVLSRSLGGESIDVSLVERTVGLFARAHFLANEPASRDPTEDRPHPPARVATLRAAYGGAETDSVVQKRVLLGLYHQPSEGDDGAAQVFEAELPKREEPTVRDASVLLAEAAEGPDPEAHVLLRPPMAHAPEGAPLPGASPSFLVPSGLGPPVKQAHVVTEVIERINPVVQTPPVEAPASEATTGKEDPQPVGERTIARGLHHLPERTRDIFERLQRAGVQARSYPDDARDDARFSKRRRDRQIARRFDQGIESLTAGDLDLALEHFRSMLNKVPSSKRILAFVKAIERESAEPESSGGRTEDLLQSFQGAVRDAIDYGRCPRCFSMVESTSDTCFACGLVVSKD